MERLGNSSDGQRAEAEQAVRTLQEQCEVFKAALAEYRQGD